MKRLALLLIPVALLFQNCSSQTNYLEPAVVKQITEKNEFTFMALRAVPSGADVNNIMMNLPPRTSTRMLELSYGYTLSIKNGVLTADLPYFGRVFNPSYGLENQGMKFTSRDYNLEKKQGKNGAISYTIRPNDVNRVMMVYVDIYKNGKSYVSINSNDRQPISYDGYITSETTPAE